MGAATGLAYPTKSLSALLVLPIWAAMRLQTDARRRCRKEKLQDVSDWRVPASPRTSVSTHCATEVIENQGGHPWTCLRDMPRFFGELVWIPLGAKPVPAVLE